MDTIAPGFAEQNVPDQIYKIIGDETELRKFYKLWISPQSREPNHYFGLVLRGRRKYYPALSNSEKTTCNKVIKAGVTEDEFVNAIQRMMIPVGTYYDSSGTSIPLSALVLYITINPLNHLRALTGLQRKLSEHIEHLLLTPNEKTPQILNPDAEYFSQLHSSDYKVWTKLDVDTRDPLLITELNDLLKRLGVEIGLIIKTKNGLHYAIRKGSISKSAHQAMYKFAQEHIEWMSIENGSPMLAVPGTTQGGFTPIIVD